MHLERKKVSFCSSWWRWKLFSYLGHTHDEATIVNDCLDDGYSHWINFRDAHTGNWWWWWWCVHACRWCGVVPFEFTTVIVRNGIPCDRLSDEHRQDSSLGEKEHCQFSLNWWNVQLKHKIFQYPNPHPFLMPCKTSICAHRHGLLVTQRIHSETAFLEWSRTDWCVYVLFTHVIMHVLLCVHIYIYIACVVLILVVDDAFLGQCDELKVHAWGPGRNQVGPHYSTFRALISFTSNLGQAWKLQSSLSICTSIWPYIHSYPFHPLSFAFYI